MRESVKKLVEVLNGGYNRGCNQYGCKRGAGGSASKAGSRKGSAAALAGSTTKAFGLSRKAMMSGSSGDHAAAQVAHEKLAKKYKALGDQRSAINHESQAKHHSTSAYLAIRVEAKKAGRKLSDE